MNTNVKAELTYPLLATIFDFPGVSLPRVRNALNQSVVRFTSVYSGGEWHIDYTGKFGRVVCPPPSSHLAPAGKYPVTVQTNGYQGDMDGDTFGAAITLLVFNQLVWAFADMPYCPRDEYARLEKKFYAMKTAFINDKRLDGAAILGFID